MKRVPLLVFAGVLAVLYIIVFFPDLTGVSAHEWLGLVIFVLLVIHITINADRPIKAAKSLFKRGKKGSIAPRALRLALNIVLLVCLVLCIISGLMISATVLPVFGLYVPGGYYIWNPIHSVSATLLLALLVVHVVLQARFIFSSRKKDNRKKKEDELSTGEDEPAQ